MTDRSLEIIYALKQGEKPWEKVITEFSAKETGNPSYIATQLELYDIIKEVFIDYISTCDHPENVVRILLHCIDVNGSMGMAHHMARTLRLQQVKSKDEDGNFYYINGFRSLIEN